MKQYAVVAGAGISADALKVNALYMLGGAAEEQSNYLEAEEFFTQIVNMGKDVNNLKLGWAHAELVRLWVWKHAPLQAICHLGRYLDILQELGSMD